MTTLVSTDYMSGPWPYDPASAYAANVEHAAAENTSAPETMQIVTRIEKVQPVLSRQSMLEAVAHAVATYFRADPTRADRYPEWRRRGMRKHVRRARGTAWDAVTLIPGQTVTYRGAMVHICDPALPADTPETVTGLPPFSAALPTVEHVPPPPLPGTRPFPRLHIWLCPQPYLPDPTAAAAVGHLAQLVALDGPPTQVNEWFASGALVTVHATSGDAWPGIVGEAEYVDYGVHDTGNAVAPGTVNVAGLLTHR